ncbi:MAG: valine--tRNA ligase [Candidatus Gracilibacteria bacterium]|nr:valine--tRNA ligase [Candidatus Gracilibacteria bacterium]
MSDKTQKNELPKAYVAKDYEDALYKMWEESGVFEPNMESDKKPFVITMPPPNATGTLHLGHSVMLALEDIMIRFHRMKGHPTLWVPGTDHAGIATQNKVEKDVMEKEGKTRHDYGRETFIKMIEEFVAGSQNTIRNQTRKMGSSCDWSREYYSLDESLSKTVFTTFKKMFTDGLIYRGNRIVNWCTRCQSTISDDEVDYQETTAKLYTFKYDKDFPFEISTTRPETKLGDTGVAVNPEDKRYKHLIGNTLEANFLGQKLKLAVIGDEHIDMKFGTGALGVTPNHSIVDDEMAKNHGLERIQVIMEDGTIAKGIGKYAGMEVEAAKKAVAQDLEAAGLMSNVEDIPQNLSVCSRCKTPIQPLVSKQWFIDVNHPVDSWDHEGLQLEKGRAYSLKEVMQHVVRDQQIEIIPDRFNKTYFQWIDNLRDWCISRQLWWGHQIPVWINDSDMDDVKVQEDSPGEGWTRDSDTLDTWFSAGLFTFSPLKWIDGHDDFKTFHPTQVLETGYDILFFWVARMILMTTYMTGQVPFEKVYLHGLIRTREGKKMSKSNPETCINPLDVIDKYGADALRLSLFVGSSPGNDSRLYDEKIAGYRNFVNKLWNVARYVLISVEETPSLLKGGPKVEPKTLADKWILSRLQEISESTSKDIAEYKFSQAAENLYAFTWNDLADWYIEITKVQKQDESLVQSTDQILMYILKTLLKLWHPFTPYVTEELWKHVAKEGMLISAEWPTIQGFSGDKTNKQFELIRESISVIRNLRAEYQVEPAKKIEAEIVSKEHHQLISDNASIIEFLGRLESLTVKESGEAPEGSTSKFVEGLEIHIPLAGMVDADKEKERLTKEIAKLEDYIQKLDAKLSNEKFAKNAPEQVVAAEKERLATSRESLKKCQEQLEQL